jgi:hypothetical protein
MFQEPPQGLLMRSTEEALRQQQFQQHMQRARLVHNGDAQFSRPDAAVQFTRPEPPQQNNQYGRQLEERDRQRKLEEMRRKQLELEAAREAEERILRDAQLQRRKVNINAFSFLILNHFIIF